MINKIIFLGVILYTSSTSLGQHAIHIKTPAKSPTQTIKQDFGIGSVELSYSRPKREGRTIFGSLVPYNKIWRTGANSATLIKFNDTVIISGKQIPKGKYGLVTIPGEESWIIILTKSTDIEHPDNYKKENDVLRTTIKSIMNKDTVESFTIQFSNVLAETMDILFQWENTTVVLPVKTDVEKRIKQQVILQNMGNDSSRCAAMLLEAAIYFFETNINLAQALQWCEDACKIQMSSTTLHYKARILQKMGYVTEAISIIKESDKLAKKEENIRMLRLNERLIAELE